MKKFGSRLISVITAFMTFVSVMNLRIIQTPFEAKAATAAHRETVVVVSLGDSYSSGEGIEPFYGQNNSNGAKKDWYLKSSSNDWLAHRSVNSWPGMLTIPGIPGTLKDYKASGENAVDSDVCKWYFCAASGAVTSDYSGQQLKTTKESLFSGSVDHWLPTQLSIFDKINNDGDVVDYVTMTIGGNDVGFVDILSTRVLGSFCLAPSTAQLSYQIAEIFSEWDTVYGANIKKAYLDTYREAGDQAYILIAGYPQLLYQDISGYNLAEIETVLISESVTEFNRKLSLLVDECNRECETDHFVFIDVEKEFSGHAAYSGSYNYNPDDENAEPASDGPWLNDVGLTKSEDLDHTNPLSAYSMHPNKRGAEAYARCVNAEIARIEKLKQNETYAIDAPDADVTWAVKPTIIADDILVGDRYVGFGDFISSPYVYIKWKNKYGLIGYDGKMAVKPTYDRFNGDDFYGMDDYIAVYDSENGETKRCTYDSEKKKWSLTSEDNTYGVVPIGTQEVTFFIDESDGKLYKCHHFLEQPEEYFSADASFVVQKINCVRSKYGIGDSTATDEKFYLYYSPGYNGESFVTKGYKYVYSNGNGSCIWSGDPGSRTILQENTTVAFSNDMKKWDLYDSLGRLIASDLETFDCNIDRNPWWAPATSFFNDAKSYTSSKNIKGKAAPFCATEGYIAAKKDGKCGYLDLDGNIVVPFGVFDDVRPVHNGKAWVKFNGKWGVISFG